MREIQNESSKVKIGRKLRKSNSVEKLVFKKYRAFVEFLSPGISVREGRNFFYEVILEGGKRQTK